MNPVVSFVRSTIGRKFLMAITGLVLLGFVTGHLVGNLHIFFPPDDINGYASFLQSLGPVLWLIRGFLLACTVIHVWAAATLMLDSTSARGPEKYGINKWINAGVASRYMRFTGLVVLAFIVYHIAHFTVGVAQASTFKANLPEYTMAGDFKLLGLTLAHKGDVVHDVYSMVFLGFANPVVSLFYIVAVGLLAAHLLHGADSLFQTIGFRNGRWASVLRAVVVIYSVVYFLGNLAIPGSILAGVVKPQAGTYAAQHMAAAPSQTAINR